MRSPAGKPAGVAAAMGHACEAPFNDAIPVPGLEEDAMRFDAFLKENDYKGARS